MNYGYGRCSTNEKQQDISRQIRELKNQGVDEENIYFEYASGIKEDRIQLKKLLEIVKSGDTIVATEVSRIIKLVLGSFIVDCIKELDPMTERNFKDDGHIC